MSFFEFPSLMSFRDYRNHVLQLSRYTHPELLLLSYLCYDADEDSHLSHRDMYKAIMHFDGNERVNRDIYDLIHYARSSLNALKELNFPQLFVEKALVRKKHVSVSAFRNFKDFGKQINLSLEQRKLTLYQNSFQSMNHNFTMRENNQSFEELREHLAHELVVFHDAETDSFSLNYDHYFHLYKAPKLPLLVQDILQTLSGQTNVLAQLVL